MTLEPLGQYIKAERERRNLTLRQLEEYSGVSYSMINKIENGGLQSISIDTLEKLARGLRVDFDELVRIARGLPPYPVDQPGWTPRVQELVKETDAMTPEEQEQMIQYARFLLHQRRQIDKT